VNKSIRKTRGRAMTPAPNNASLELIEGSGKRTDLPESGWKKKRPLAGTDRFGEGTFVNWGRLRGGRVDKGRRNLTGESKGADYKGRTNTVSRVPAIVLSA